MMKLLLLVFIGLLAGPGFREKQKEFGRVRQAYAEKYSSAQKIFADAGLHLDRSEIFLKVHKFEKEIQLWGRTKGQEEGYKLIKVYKVCELSGVAGPKRKRGDLQTPEGFYFIDRFNPSSSYHLSLGINYPNSCDKYNCNGSDAGGDIFIHGKCVTIGCLPVTDDQINELYIISVEAKNNGQENIPVAIFPCDMNSALYGKLKTDPNFAYHLKFWANLKEGFDLFHKNKKLPVITQVKGAYHFS